MKIRFVCNLSIPITRIVSLGDDIQCTSDTMKIHSGKNLKIDKINDGKVYIINTNEQIIFNFVQNCMEILGDPILTTPPCCSGH